MGGSEPAIPEIASESLRWPQRDPADRPRFGLPPTMGSWMWCDRARPSAPEAARPETRRYRGAPLGEAWLHG